VPKLSFEIPAIPLVELLGSQDRLLKKLENLFPNATIHNRGHQFTLEGEKPDLDRDAKYWYGLDCRYNHMCLTNHRIMADKILEAFRTDTAPDLTEGFVRGLLKQNSLDDIDFVQRELDVWTFEHNRQFREKYAPKIPWAKRMGLKTFQLDK
jgi:phosphate starvation-inducible protein PhoH